MHPNLYGRMRADWRIETLFDSPDARQLQVIPSVLHDLHKERGLRRVLAYHSHCFALLLADQMPHTRPAADLAGLAYVLGLDIEDDVPTNEAPLPKS